MSPKSHQGKVFMQDKEKLLHLAETISAGKELDIQHKVDRTKATAASDDKLGRLKDSKRRRRGSEAAASDKLRAAKALVAARQTRLKREKHKARKRQVQTSKSDGKVSRESGPSNSAEGALARKKVSFA